MDLNLLLGPLGLTAGLVVAVGWLAKQLVGFVREYIAGLRADLTTALAGWQEQSRANQVLADAQASRNRDDELRHRLADAEQKAAK